VPNCIYIYIYIYVYIYIYIYNQTTEHILFECALLNEDRERLICCSAKKDNWPINKDMLIKKHYKAFAKFTKQIDKIKEMNS
jgi:hypothetical protein